MSFQLRIKNYRGFGADDPAELRIERGITALIGGNNAGKSTLLRFFYELRPVFVRLGCAEAFMQCLRGPQPAPSMPADWDALFHQQHEGDMVVELRPEPGDWLPPAPDREALPPGRVDVVLSRRKRTVMVRLDGVGGEAVLDGGAHAVVHIDGRPVADWPVLEVLFRRLAATMYVSPYRVLRVDQEQESSYDLRLGGHFVKDWTTYQQERPAAAAQAREKIRREIAHLFRLEDFDFEPDASGRSLVFQMNGGTVPADEMGSAIGQCVLVFAQALIRGPDYLLIDEPECHLHPGLQADFVTALNGYARRGLIMATHSMGLARSTADRIYEVRRSAGSSATRILPYTPEERLSEALGEMNFSIQQTMGCRKILLVEGPTEIKAVRQWLRQIGGDRDVVIVPLGGSSMINARRGEELAEIGRICPDVYALIDSEKARPGAPMNPDREGFVRSCRKAGIDCHVLERRALENYFTTRAIKSALGGGYRELGSHGDVKAIYSRWPKSENWRIVSHMKWAEVADTDLGRFLLKVVRAPCRSERRR